MTADIVQIIPATGWSYEDRSGASHALKSGASIYFYTHDPIVCFALVEYREDDGDTWRAVRGVTRWDDDYVSLESCVPTATLSCGGDCDDEQAEHPQALPKRATA